MTCNSFNKNHEILTDAQHGFRQKRSCVWRLTFAGQDLAKGKDNREQLDVILLNVAKALDEVPHGRLLPKIDFYGIRNSTHAWIADFLCDRTQQPEEIPGPPFFQQTHSWTHSGEPRHSKYLGIQLHKKLSRNYHIHQVIQKG